MMITGKQIRAARVLTDWDADDLAQRIGMSRVSVQNIERGDARPKPETLDKIIRAFSDVGIEFIENEGVRRRAQSIEIFEGSARFDDFYDFLFDHLKEYGGEVCIANSDPFLYKKYHNSFQKHKQRMEELVLNGNIKYKILVKEGTTNFTASSYAEYKWQPESSFSPTSFYAFGKCLALISFDTATPPYVILIKSGPLAQAYRQSFDIAWESASSPNLSRNL